MIAVDATIISANARNKPTPILPLRVTLRPSLSIDQGSIIGPVLLHELTFCALRSSSFWRRLATPLGTDEAVGVWRVTPSSLHSSLTLVSRFAIAADLSNFARDTVIVFNGCYIRCVYANLTRQRAHELMAGRPLSFRCYRVVDLSGT
jgi:hypothetical protein